MGKSETGQLKNNFFSRFIIIFAGLFFVFSVAGFVREYAKSREVDNDLAGLERELTRLKMEKNNFLKSIDSFQSEFFLEQEARTKFNLKKEGERVVVIPESNLGAVVADDKALAVSAETNKSAWRNAVSWWDYFFADKN